MLYELAVLGRPTDDQLRELEQGISRAVRAFGMNLGTEVGWSVGPRIFKPEQRRSSAAVYFGAGGIESRTDLDELRKLGIPILPVVSALARVSDEIPEALRSLNCLEYVAGDQRVAAALLECCGLLPRQRRVFLSYKRSEAREAAVQLFDELSSRVFDVFLDTHGVPPAADFQSTLWHRLCDSDVLLMLDTPSYFDSRWTSAEFGRALAKDIAILRVGWPDAAASARTATASLAQLVPEELDPATGRLAPAAVARICSQLEVVRSESRAVRTLNLVSNLRIAIEKVGGRVVGVGLRHGVHLELPDRGEVVVYPAVGVPTSVALHDAAVTAAARSTAVVYDPIGLDPAWLEHLDWLGTHVRGVKWVKLQEAAWQFAGWEG